MATAYYLSPIAILLQQFSNLGQLLSGGKVYIYQAGTTTFQTTYADSGGSGANPNPILLNSAGRLPNGIWVPGNAPHKLILLDANNVQLAGLDNLYGINDPEQVIAQSAFLSSISGSSSASGASLVGYNSTWTTVKAALDELFGGFGFQQGLATDGDAVTFSPAYINNPLVWFGPGGLSYDSSLTGNQMQSFQATNITPTGFTPKLKIQNSSTVTAESMDFAGNATVQTATNSYNGSAYDNNYTVNATFTVPALSNQHGEPIEGRMVFTVYYSTDGISYTQIFSQEYYNFSTSVKTINFSQPFSITGIVKNSTWKIQSSTNSLATSGNTVTFNGGSPSGAVAATGSGIPSVPWTSYGQYA